MDRNPTWKLKDIWNNYTDFSTWIKSVSNIHLQTYFTDLTVDDKVVKFVWNCLWDEYMDAYIWFEEIDTFKNKFACTYDDIILKVQVKMELLRSIYHLTAEDMRILSEDITNQAMNPNTAPDDVTNALNFISQQASSYQKGGKLNGYLTALGSIPEMDEGYVIRSFSKLFNNIYTGEEYIY